MIMHIWYELADFVVLLHVWYELADFVVLLGEIKKSLNKQGIQNIRGLHRKRMAERKLTLRCF